MTNLKIFPGPWYIHAVGYSNRPLHQPGGGAAPLLGAVQAVLLLLLGVILWRG